MSAEDYLEELCVRYGWDFSIKACRALETAWSAEVRVTLEPHRRGLPDRSVVSYSVGGTTEVEAIDRATADMIEWLEAVIENGVAPFGLRADVPSRTH